MVPGHFFMMPGQFSWVQVGFYGFSRFQVDFSWFQVVFHGFYDSRSGFHDSRWILMSLMVPGWFFLGIHGSRSVFYDSMLVFMVLGWFISELSAGGAK